MSTEDGKMLIETNTIVKELKERMDRHSHDYERTFQGIWDEMKEMRREVGGAISTLEKEVSTLKAERGLMIKVITPIVGTISGALAGIISGHIKS